MTEHEKNHYFPNRRQKTATAGIVPRCIRGWSPSPAERPQGHSNASKRQDPAFLVIPLAAFFTAETRHAGLQKACIDRLDRRIHLFGRENLLEHLIRLTSGADPRWSPPYCAMAVIGLVTVGLLACGFMLYVLFQWMQETVRKD